ncbi:lipase [Nocardia stercoris]|uniref:Lipase n=1 Tax=Nocardia stercoris TaxID=2483361 RepID=A0A3M2L6N1_9NOCA|nr:lipase [Nocardia stercoris]
MSVPPTAQAQGPAGPGFALPGPDDPGPGLPGLSLPELQQWIQRALPAPPLNPVPGALATPAGLPTDLARLAAAVQPDPVGDPMFDNWPADLADYAPGDVLETRDVTPTATLLSLWPLQRAEQLKFRTTDAHGNPSFATATLLVPADAWTGPGARPVVVDALPIDALGRNCTPGYDLAHGYGPKSAPLEESFLPPSKQLAFSRGYAVLIPDHEGPLMAYAEPYVAGHAVLDSIRAVRSNLPGEFGDSKFAMTGYSGGAIAVHGAVALMGSYAPELSDVVVGAALGGVPADFGLLAQSMNANLASGVFLAAALGVAREHPELLQHMNKAAAWAASSPLKDTCSGEFSLAGVFMLPMDVAADFPDPLHSELADSMYTLSRMEGMKSPVPLYIYHGDQEFWVPVEGAKAYFRQQCDLGVPTVYRGVPGEHELANYTGYPGMVTWIDQRLQGLPASDEC